jgi:anti-anti-sigma factor
MDDETVRVDVSEGSRGARLSGEIDMASYEELLGALAPLFDGQGDVTLDLAEVSFVDSTAIRLFAQLQRSRTGEDHVILVSPQPHVARVLEVAGVSDLGIRITRREDV